jgi:hypothetical protein
MSRGSSLLKVASAVSLIAGLLYFFDWGFTQGLGDYHNPVPYAIIALFMVGSFVFASLSALLAKKSPRIDPLSFGLLVPIFLMVTAYNFFLYVVNLPGQFVFAVYLVGLVGIFFGPDLVKHWRRNHEPTADAGKDPDIEQL